MAEYSVVLITSFVLGALATTLTGCRFGNHISGSDSNPDKISGFYGTLPQKLTFCASHSSTQCGDAATNQIPDLIAAEMTNPTALILQDKELGEAVLTAYSGGRTALPVWLGADGTTLYFVSSFSPQKLWRDSRCTSRMYLEEEGQIVPGPTEEVPGSSRTTQGRIQLKIRVTEVFEESTLGVCAASLQAMSDCYQEVSRCGGGDSAENLEYQALVQNMFEPYIAAHAMTASDIASLTNIAYEIQYE